MTCTDSDYSSLRPGPTALVGLGPGLGQRSWSHGPYRWVEVQGPSGPRDPCAVQEEMLV